MSATDEEFLRRVYLDITGTIPTADKARAFLDDKSPDKRAKLIDEMHFAISPVMLGAGEHLFAGIDALSLGYACTEYVGSANAMRVVLTRNP